MDGLGRTNMRLMCAWSTSQREPVAIGIIRKARIYNVGKYQSCMVSKFRIIFTETRMDDSRAYRERAAVARGCAAPALPVSCRFVLTI